MDDERLFDDYDAFAEAYVEATRDNLYNARYERPALQALAGSVRGLAVLDVGCAGGEQSLWLHGQGARVMALDANAKMIEIARRRCPAEIDLRVHDLREPLPVAKESIDLVFSSLTLHYIREWEPLLRDFRRVTKPGGALVFSTHHPCMGLHENDELGIDYFSTGLIVDHWSGFGPEPVHVRYWRRPLQSMISSIVETGWRIEKILEPRLGDAIDPWFLLIRASR